MKVLIKKVFVKLKNFELFGLILIGQMLLHIILNHQVIRYMNFIQFLNNYNFCNFVIMTIVFIISISKVIDIEPIKSKFSCGLKFISYKKLTYINKFIYILILMFFSACISFLELLVLVNKFGYVNFSYILVLKQSFYPPLGYLPFLVLQFSISMLTNKKSASFACGVIGYFLGVLGSIGISLKFGIFNLWAYPFYTSPVITDSIYGFSVENNKSETLIIISLIITAIMILISLHFYEKEELPIT